MKLEPKKKARDGRRGKPYRKPQKEKQKSPNYRKAPKAETVSAAWLAQLMKTGDRGRGSAAAPVEEVA